MKDKTNEMRKPGFEMICGVYDIQPGYQGVLRRFGTIISVVGPGRVAGFPFIHDIALVPELPIQIEDHKRELRTRDNRLVEIVSYTNVVINDPVTFMRKAPEGDYERLLSPSIDQATQQVISSNYTASEVVGKNDEVSTRVKEQLETALRDLEWGFTVKLFRYTSSIDKADVVDGDVRKLRPVELADAEARKITALVAAETAAQAEYAQKKYQVDAAVYGIIKEGEATAKAIELTGITEAAILEKRMGIYVDCTEKVIEQLSSGKAKFPTEEVAPILISTLDSLLGKLTVGKSDGSPSERIKEAFIQKLEKKYQGQAEGQYLQGLSAGGSVNPNLALVVKMVPKILEEWKKSKPT